MYTLSIWNKKKNFQSCCDCNCFVSSTSKCSLVFFPLLLLPSAQQKQEERGKHFMAHLCSFLFRFFLRVFVYVLITFMWLIYVEGSRHKMPAVSASRVCVCGCGCGWCVSWLTWHWAEERVHNKLMRYYRERTSLWVLYTLHLLFHSLFSLSHILACYFIFRSSHYLYINILWIYPSHIYRCIARATGMINDPAWPRATIHTTHTQRHPSHLSFHPSISPNWTIYPTIYLTVPFCPFMHAGQTIWQIWTLWESIEFILHSPAPPRFLLSLTLSL